MLAKPIRPRASSNSEDLTSKLDKMNILGINIDVLSYEDMYPIFDKWLVNKNSRSRSLALVNVNCCVSSLFDTNLRNIYNSADLIGIDSMPFLFLARAIFNPKADRFYAPDLMHEIGSKAADKGYTFFFYGGFPGAPEAMKSHLKERFDGIQIVGTYSPPFRPLTEEEDQAICDMINEVQPDFIWVGLGSPKQDVWIFEHREKIKGAIFIASGATFDFVSGRIRQAPKWIRNVGLEWLYRFTQDFRRLWKRYTIYNVIFVTVFLLQLMRIVRFENQDSLTKRR